MSRKIPFRRTLLGQALLLGVLPAVVVVLAIVGVNATRAWNGIVVRIEGDLVSETAAAVKEIDTRNARNIGFVRMIALAQESGQFGRRAEALRMLERVLRTNPSVYAAYIAYEPNADGQDSAGAQPGVPANALGQGGRFYPYFKRDPSSPNGFTLEPLQDTGEDGDLWYALPKERFERAGVAEAVVTKPYTYLGTDIIEYVMPIVRDGRFAGIAGLDIALTDVQAQLDALAEHLGADLFLETRGQIVAATTDATGGTKLRAAKVEGSPVEALFDADFSRDATLAKMFDPSLGEECYVVTASVPTGGWRLVARKPTSAVAAEITGLVRLNLITAAAGVVVIVAILSFGAVRLSRRVQAAESIATRIADGDLTAPAIAVRGDDESASLVKAMNTMNADLAGIVSAVRAASARLAATSAQLAATTREQGATASSFGGSTAQIAAAIREISATGDELLRSVQTVDAGARRTAEAAAAGRGRLDAMATSMSRLDGATAEIGDRLEVIAEKAAAISTVVTTITKVAEQTNLLSVTAAIEAEKAGEAGYGFLVVAREIRRLADQTAVATTDIERMVRQMQESVAAGVSEMKRFASEMRIGTGDAKRVANDLSGIMNEMNAAFASFSEVQRGMASQTSGVAQIEEAVNQVAAGAQQSATSAAESARVADEVAHAVAVLDDAAARFTVSAQGPNAAKGG
ncbi:MAG: methyl-accepting chemotaxis protein [bacterium]